MKKLLTILMLVTLTACTQPESNSSGMMCEKCPCCQKMMEGGKQCPMMKGEKMDGMQCSCCQGMKDDMGAKKQPQISTPADHTAHH